MWKLNPIAPSTPLHAEVKNIEGTIKSVDTAKRTITVETDGKSKSLDLSSKVKITKDGEEESLDSLKSGQQVTISYHDDLEVVLKIDVTTASDGIPTPAQAEGKSPPKDAATFKGHSYKFFSDVMSWHRAKKRCEEMGGHLATISNADEERFVVNLATKGISVPTPMDGIWMGATDEEKEGEWKWIDGTKSKYSNWEKGQPNNKQENEHYLLYWLKGKSWVDQPDKSVQHPAYFVCEWDAPNSIVVGKVSEKNLEADAEVLKMLQGEWKCIAGEHNGKPQEKSVVKHENRRFTIEGNTLTMTRTGMGGRFGTYSGKFSIDASNGHLDWVGKVKIGDAEPTFMEWIGIYELDGDTLKVVYIDGKAKRPAFKFAPVPKGLNHIFYTMKRDNE